MTQTTTVRPGIEKRREQIAALHSEGRTNKEIVVVLGINYNTVQNDLKALGLKRNGSTSDSDAAAKQMEERLAQRCRTACGKCGADHIGSLRDGSRWFREEHVCAARAAAS